MAPSIKITGRIWTCLAIYRKVRQCFYLLVCYNIITVLALQVEATDYPNSIEGQKQWSNQSSVSPTVPDARLGYETNLFSGTFGYSIPIKVPPGRGGSQPAVSLAYNSRSGNGWCGVGWSLGAGGYIKRRGDTGVPRRWIISQMEFAAGVLDLPRVINRKKPDLENAYDDAIGFEFSLGGAASRLVDVGAGEYRAEIERGAGLQFKYLDPQWVVTDKMGTQYFFGLDETARSSHPDYDSGKGSSAFLWALQKVVDRNGNLTQYTYTKDGNHLYPERIQYNGHSGGIAPSHEIQFVLEDRPDKTFSFLSGFREETNKRLESIVVKVDQNLVRRYEVDYIQSATTARSLIDQVQEFGSDSSSALPAITFNYQQKSGDGFVGTVSDVTFPRYSPYFPISHLSYGYGHDRFRVMDIDGDALPDRVSEYRIPLSPPGQPVTGWEGGFRMQYNNGDNTFSSDFDHAEISTSPALQDDVKLERLIGWNSPSAIYDVSITYQASTLVDINGDGYIDRVRAPEDSYAYQVQLNLGDGFGAEEEFPGLCASLLYIGAFNALYSADRFPVYQSIIPAYRIFSPTPNSAFPLAGATTTTSTAYAELKDMNGDSLPDRIMIPDAFVDEYYRGTNLNDPNFPAPDFYLVQFNTGDGFEEEFTNWFNVDSSDLGMNLISYGFKVQIFISEDTDIQTGIHSFSDLVDLNGDGLPDRVFREKTYSGSSVHWWVQWNNGAGFEDKEQWGPFTMSLTHGGASIKYTKAKEVWNTSGGGAVLSGAASQVMLDLLDMNGDDLIDLIEVDSNDFNVRYNTGSTFASPVAWTGFSTISDTVTGMNSRGTAFTQYQGVGLFQLESALTSQILDFNGDGLVDLVYGDTANTLKLHSNSDVIPDLMKTVENGIGGTISVSYKSSSEFDNRDRPWTGDPWTSGAKSLLPYPLQVVSQLSIDDGMGNVGTTIYDYQGGMHDGERREFRGFHCVAQIQPNKQKILTFYHQGGGWDASTTGEFQDDSSLGKQGIPYRTEVYGTNNPQAADPTYDLYKVTLNKVDELKLLPTGPCFPYISQTIEMDYVPGTTNYRATARQFAYNFKNVSLGMEAALGEVTSVDDANHTFSNVKSADDVYTHIHYAKIANQDVTALPGLVKITSDASGSSVLRANKFKYDAKGNLLKRQSMLKE